MGVDVKLHLFLEPADEIIPAGEVPTPGEVRDLAKGLHARLCRVADILETLDQDGWDVVQGVHEITCSHDDLESEEEAEERLKDLEIDPKEVEIESSWQEEEEQESPLTREELKDLLRFLRRKDGVVSHSLALTEHWVRCRPFPDREKVLRYLRWAYGTSDSAVWFNLCHEDL